MARILLATPAYGDMFYTPYVSSVIRLQRLLTRDKHELIFAAISYADIVESRNFLLTHWYDKTDATPYAVHRRRHGLRAAADRRHGHAEEAAGRRGLPQAADRSQSPGRARRRAARKPSAPSPAPIPSWSVRSRAGKPRIVNGFMEVEGCGAGIMLIERGLIKTMLEKMPRVERHRRQEDLAARQGPRPPDPRVRSGDRQRRAAVGGLFVLPPLALGCGGEIWANISHPITHVGLHRYSRPLSGRDAARPAHHARHSSRPGGGGRCGEWRDRQAVKPVASAAVARATVKEGGAKRAAAVAASAAAPERVVRRTIGHPARQEKAQRQVTAGA